MVAVCILATVVAADVRKPPPPPPAVAAKLTELKARWAKADSAYYQAGEKLPDTPAGRAKYQELRGPYLAELDAVGRDAVAFAKADPAAALPVIEWYLCGAGYAGQPSTDAALDFATEHYAADPRAVWVLSYIASYFPPATSPKFAAGGRFATAAAAANPNRHARGHARLALARAAFDRTDRADREHGPDADALAANAITAFEALRKEYADVTWWGQGSGRFTLGDRAASVLAALRHLRVGKPAPPLAGEALPGGKVSLADYRGKVTVVVFWATWCPPCMRAIPHEKALAETYKGRPFAILGVNGDMDRAKGQAAADREKLPWASVWAGPDGPRGDVCRGWNAERWPVVYVLDGAGVVRAKRVAGADLDAAVAKLMAGQ